MVFQLLPKTLTPPQSNLRMLRHVGGELYSGQTAVGRTVTFIDSQSHKKIKDEKREPWGVQSGQTLAEKIFYEQFS